MASSSAYEDVRAAIAEKGSDARVEVNQRALIDKVSDLRETFLFVFTIVLKNDTQHSSLHYVYLIMNHVNPQILARYATAGAVYRELLQNSNDAEATTAEIIITTSSASNNDNGEKKKPKEEVVTQIIYRNNGHPFRPQDWARLRKIAEGNPDEVRMSYYCNKYYF